MAWHGMAWHGIAWHGMAVATLRARQGHVNGLLLYPA